MHWRLAWLTCSAMSATLAFAAPADDLRALLEKGQGAAAYALGKQHAEQLGNPEFDFHFGVAAIDAGHAGEGVLALERYVISFPDNDLARLELARGYYVLGEFVRAREEFQAVSAKRPSANVQATVDRYLDAIRAQESRYQTSSSLYLEAGIGLDSNVNGGVGSSNINLPVFGAVTLNQVGVKTGDSFAQFAAGGQISKPVAPGVQVFGGLSFDGKYHRSSFDTQFDQQTFAANVGVSVIRERDLYRLSYAHSTLEVDNKRFRSTNGANAEWHRQLDELQSMSLFGQYAHLDYPGQAVREADFYGLGLGYRKSFIGMMQPVLQLTGSYGRERNDAQRPDLSRDLFGGRVAVSLTPAARWGFNVGLNYTESRFDQQDPLFGVGRKDRYLSADATLSYQWNRNWSVRGEYLHSDNRSSVALYKFDRDLVAVKIRYDFK